MPYTTLGPFTPSTTTAIAVNQGQPWSATNNVTSEDNAVASAQGFDDPVTDTQAWRVATNGTIPSTATIESVTIRIRARYSAGAAGTLNADLYADSTGSLGAALTSGPTASNSITNSFANYDVVIPKGSISNQTTTRNAFNSGHIWISLAGIGDAGGTTFAVDFVEILSVIYTTPTQNYNRPKSITTNDTPITFSVLASESPNGLAALANPGNSGIVDVLYRADADETGGADVQDLARFTFTPILSADGTIQLQISFTPVKGDGSDGSTATSTLTHTQTMNAWQTASGRAPQA